MANTIQKGLPENATKQILRGHQDTQLMAKESNEYGPKILNNVGVFQGSSISALLFIIYLGDMRNGYEALNDNKQIPRKHTYGRRQLEQCELKTQKITESYITNMTSEKTTT